MSRLSVPLNAFERGAPNVSAVQTLNDASMAMKSPTSVSVPAGLAERHFDFMANDATSLVERFKSPFSAFTLRTLCTNGFSARHGNLSVRFVCSHNVAVGVWVIAVDTQRFNFPGGVDALPARIERVEQDAVLDAGNVTRHPEDEPSLRMLFAECLTRHSRLSLLRGEVELTKGTKARGHE